MCTYTAVNGIYATALGASLVPEVSGLIAQLTPVLEGHRFKPVDIFRFNNAIPEFAFTSVRIFLKFKIKLFFLKMCQHQVT